MLPAHLSPYLTFNGNCKEAMEFYQSCLGGQLTMQTFGEAPMPSNPEDKEKIMHAMLQNDALSFMASDSMPGKPVTVGSNVSLSIAGTDDAKIRECYTKLGEGGTVTMPLEKAFWGDTFGMLTDRFGIHWMVNIAEKK